MSCQVKGEVISEDGERHRTGAALMVIGRVCYEVNCPDGKVKYRLKRITAV